MENDLLFGIYNKSNLKLVEKRKCCIKLEKPLKI